MTIDARMHDERAIRDGKYDKALSLLVKARQAHASWDTWGEWHDLTDAFDIVCELQGTARANEVDK